MTSNAYRAGQSDARRILNAYARRRVVLASCCHYKRPETRAEWSRGFYSIYGAGRV
jgi:hypothetical protein